MKKTSASVAAGLRNKTFVVSDGTLVLHLRPAEPGWYAVTSPFDPAITTQARSVEEAFMMAYDAQEALEAARSEIARRFGTSRPEGGSSAGPREKRGSRKSKAKAEPPAP
jgi:hypothetical protein